MNNKSWLDELEAKYGNWALDGLMRYICGLMLVVYILNSMGHLPYDILSLDRDGILAGEVWRIITFLLIPNYSNPLLFMFELMILIMCADGIEAALGSFKLTVYYLSGALFMIIASLICREIQFNSYYMYLSLFFGYATLYPNQELLFMFIIPIKIKYLAIISAILIFSNALGSIYALIALLLAFTNYFLFFAIPALKGIKYQRQQTARRQAFEAAVAPEHEYHHKCAICGRTDISNPELQFRYCTCPKCGEDGVAYCIDHIAEHKATMESENKG